MNIGRMNNSRFMFYKLVSIYDYIIGDGNNYKNTYQETTKILESSEAWSKLFKVLEKDIINMGLESFVHVCSECLNHQFKNFEEIHDLFVHIYENNILGVFRKQMMVRDPYPLDHYGEITFNDEATIVEWVFGPDAKKMLAEDKDYKKEIHDLCKNVFSQYNNVTYISKPDAKIVMDLKFVPQGKFKGISELCI